MSHTPMCSFLEEDICFPVSMHDHFSQTIWVGQPNDEWDSGLYGIIVYPINKAQTQP